MFVRNARDAEPFVAADLSEIRLLVDRVNTGIASVSLAHATVAPGAETVWHRLESADEIYFVLLGRGLVWVGDGSRQVGPGDTVRGRALMRQLPACGTGSCAVQLRSRCPQFLLPARLAGRRRNP